MKIITISGSAGSGKDTVGYLIHWGLHSKEKRVLVTHYADLLKYVCKRFLKWNGVKDKVGRDLLQHIGTDIVRKKNTDYWVDFIIFWLKILKDNWDWVIIPDARFPNEVNKLTEEGFDVIHVGVVRPNQKSELTDEQKNHLSERALDSITPDYCFNNSGTIEDLSKQIDDFIKEILNEG